MLRKKYKIVIMIMALTVMGIVSNIWISSNWLIVNDYEYKTEKLSSNEMLNIVVLSDLHDHEFDDQNQKLADKVFEQKPDIIFLMGDMLNETSKDSSVPCELIRQLTETAPVYFALGNHEIEYMKEHPQLIQELEEAGAKVLDLEYEDIEVKGQSLRIGGMYAYAFAMDGNATTKPENMDPEVYSFLSDFQNTDRFTLMLSHRPDSFVFGEASKTWDIDLVISGHNHGGQVVLPFIGGLWGGDQGWFPEYVHGFHKKEKLNIFITSGLGSNEQLLPRFNNPPEIASIKIRGMNE